jgi:hypothetical protein
LFTFFPLFTHSFSPSFLSFFHLALLPSPNPYKYLLYFTFYPLFNCFISPSATIVKQLWEMTGYRGVGARGPLAQARSCECPFPF